MSEPRLSERLQRARQLLAEIHHVPLATADERGMPHCSPVFMAFDDSLCAYWASHTGAQHSRNIEHSGRVFISVFDSREGHGGIHMACRAELVSDEKDFTHAYETLTGLKSRFYDAMGPIEDYKGEQRLYKLEPQQLWVNISDRDDKGFIIRDRRVSVSVSDILQTKSG